MYTCPCLLRLPTTAYYTAATVAAYWCVNVDISISLSASMACHRANMVSTDQGNGTAVAQPTLNPSRDTSMAHTDLFPNLEFIARMACGTRKT